MRRRDKSTPAPGAELPGADSLPLSEVLQRLKTSAATGLDPGEAAVRSMKDGYNDLTRPGRPSALALLWGQLRSFMTLLLLGAALVSCALGEHFDALAIVAIVVLNTLLGFAQEYRAERAIEALAQWRAPKARVIRGGQVLEIAAREVVPGDILLLEAGERVAADARLIEAFALQAEEAALTGESAPVPKIAAELPPPGAGQAAGQAPHMVFTGTTVVSGSARAVVVRTGAFTELGRIAAMVTETPRSDSPLQHSLEHLARWLVGLCAAAVALVFAVGVAQGQPWSGMLMVAISLAVAAIPEGLPAAVTTALALGVQRMSRRKAIVRQLSAIETLGCASIICADKTGTLTLNEMTVARVEAPWGSVSVSGEGFEPRGAFLMAGQPVDPLAVAPLERLLTAGVLCSHGDVAHRGRRWEAVGDPTEAALVCAARKAGLDPARTRARYPILAEAPFEAHRRRMSVAVAAPAPRAAEVLVKGAPDAVLACCRWYQASSGERALTDRDRARILATAERLAGEGLRVLGVAARRVARAALVAPGSSLESVAAALERDLTFLGLVGLRDPPRPDVPAAIERARRAHVRTVMITGDHPGTARAVAWSIGLAGPGEEPLLGHEMERMSDEELREEVRRRPIFARISPAQKRRLVRVLRQEGHVVAMTGDGVNDAPALKEADIGVAMGLAGTDVARQASALVLADDNYATIVDAIEEGRTIYENIRRFVRYLLGCNAGEMLTMLGAGLLGLPVPLTALQILWVNLVTDGLPALALGMLPPVQRVMQRPPRPARESLFSRGAGEEIAEEGLVIGVSTLMVFGATLALGAGLVEARSAAFACLVVSQLLYALRCGYDGGTAVIVPPVLLGSVVVSLVMLLAVMAWPALQPVFGATWPRPAVWALVAGGSVGSFALQALGYRLGRHAAALPRRRAALSWQRSP